jgi:DNA-binding winged helix-turn-helix (wHTH) protein
MPADIVKFGDGLELDRNSYELRRVGRALKLERIPLDILLLLVERRGQLVTREEIIERIWGSGVRMSFSIPIAASTVLSGRFARF